MKLPAREVVVVSAPPKPRWEVWEEHHKLASFDSEGLAYQFAAIPLLLEGCEMMHQHLCSTPLSADGKADIQTANQIRQLMLALDAARPPLVCTRCGRQYTPYKWRMGECDAIQ